VDARRGALHAHAVLGRVAARQVIAHVAEQRVVPRFGRRALAGAAQPAWALVGLAVADERVRVAGDVEL